MYPDYERLVINDYHQKKSKNILSSLLIHPTQARIKKECLRLCAVEIQKKDEKVIRDFCEEWDDTKTCLQNIDKCDVDKFKPLSKYLKGDTTNTDPRNIHLLAWLIDFPNRPFVYGKKYELPVDMQADRLLLYEDLPAVEADAVENSNENDRYLESVIGTEVAVRERVSNIEPVRHKRKFRKVALVGVLLAVTGTGGFWWWDKMQTKDITPGNGSCMYWANDHFQPIPCSQKVPNTLVIALDTAMVKNFKKITRPDTITHQAKGHVWYSKINMKIEFFTADGVHPVVIGRRLKPITDYIINKYIHPGMALE